MTNNIVSVGDIFMSSSALELYRVTHIQQSKTFPDDPYFEVDVFVAGNGWEDHGDDNGFILSEIKHKGLTFFKAIEY
jgi:hypothetical protein